MTAAPSAPPAPAAPPAQADASTKPGRGRRLAWRLARLPLLVYLGWCLVLFSCQTRLVFPRDLAGEPLAEGAIARTIERWWITAADGSRVEAWYLPPPLAAEKPAPVVVLFHGNGELIDHIVDYAQWYQARGYAALIPEYRGYGRSGGAPSQGAITDDMLAFHELLVARAEVDRERIVYHGRSLGAGVAAQLAAHKPPAALVFESPFLSVAAFASRYWVPAFIVKHPYRTDRVLPKLGRPVLILHSRDDEIVPYSHGKKLHELTPGSTLVDLSGSHNSALASLPLYWTSVQAFLDEHVR